MAGTKARDDGCCSADFLKCVLHIFNIFFLTAGLMVLATAIWTILDKYQYVTLLTSDTYPIITYFLLFAGGLVLLVAVVGFCAAFKEHRPLLIFYTFLLLLIFLIEAMVGILAYVYQEQVHSELVLNLNNTFLNEYNIDPEKTQAIDFLQDEFDCCGAVSFSDWKYSKWKIDLKVLNKVPDSCCKTMSMHCGLRDHPSNINYDGCLDKMEEHLIHHLTILTAVGLGICVIQIFGMVYSCQLYFKLKDVHDPV